MSVGFSKICVLYKVSPYKYVRTYSDRQNLSNHLVKSSYIYTSKLLSFTIKNARIPCVQSIKNFVLESIEELKKVSWPNKQETIRLTGFVIGVSLGVGLFVMLFDLVFAHLLTVLLNK